MKSKFRSPFSWNRDHEFVCFYLGREKEAVGSAELLQADQLHQDGGGQRVVRRDAEPVHTRQD